MPPKTTKPATDPQETGVTPNPETAGKAPDAPAEVAAASSPPGSEAGAAAEAGVTSTPEADRGLAEVTARPRRWTVKCVRPQGIWRAGKFWPNEVVPVYEGELTPEALEALEAEPLLIVKEVKE